MIMPSLTSLIPSSNNLVFHTIFALFLTFFFSILKIPALFLHGLQTYIHPDDVNPGGNSSGVRAAIRRPGAMDSEQPKPRKKSKERFEFDESKAQIFRLKLSEGLAAVFEVVPKWILDFSFGSLDGLGKLLLAVIMGCIVGCLYIPALRSARAFWLGTDQIRCNLSIISCGWFSRMLLYATYIIAVFTSLLWITPFAEFLVNKNADGKNGLHVAGKRGEVLELVGYIGMSRSNFDNLRVWCLLITGLLQLLAVRANAQMFLNEAVLCWYQRLHASKVPDLDYSRAKVFLHNHYICAVVVQFFVPAAVVLLLLGLSQFDDNFLKGTPGVHKFLPAFALVKEVALFLAWWIIFVSSVLSSAILSLFRRGTLYIS
ncbi:UNVERIFIED_CONTAM: hypothetical protein Sradi_4623700 [Sesamum radiatum]|uniref:Transmembrane protein n=1 Tax=Sesamum radiatum TaxID=300843 RepID=A0AAW2NBE8_SESRA